MDTWMSEEMLDDPEVSLTLAERTYLQLREDIITVQLAPGTILKENDVMRRLDVGRTPVREAFLRLQRDGFVDVNARRGTFVSRIDISDLTAIYEARARIESWATRLAAERLREPERREAGELIEALKALSLPSELDALLALDRRIHRFIYRCAKNRYLFDTLDHYHNLSLRILHVAMRRFPELAPELDKVVLEQTLMLEAVCRGDADTAERIALHHVLSFEQEVRKVI
ncbi:GntR family transcriptional regulator [Rhizobium multihospitium]|uniref:DNA-binding transcriptional regulator, GntR family n=1 Tax=Rhizobium multihospitium TaxID=410764 RepID=A0A1C3W5X3_9HYPH|nr:GntR family transcriptional regulator [Rhizobium multihospitium]SCB35507.1 DNA-binding transcriptional regulator, GntR family [Rhizobium multihospitium]